MKKFALKLLEVSILLIVIATVLQVAISIRIKNKNTNSHDTFLSIKNQKNDVIFLGSSRCAQHFVPRVFKDALGVNCVNLGAYAHPELPITIMKLKYYLKYNPAPKYAVLNWDIMCINGPMNFEQNTNEAMKNCFARYAFFTEHDNSMIVKYYHFNIAEQYIPLYALLKYKVLFDCITLTGGKSWLKDGYIIENFTIKLDSSSMQTARQKLSENYAQFASHYDSIKQQLKYLNAYCKDNNIKLICMQTPSYAGVYEKKLFELPQRICAELGVNYIDANIPEIANDSSNFSNVIHLNTMGAAKFCNWLCLNKEFLTETTN